MTPEQFYAQYLPYAQSVSQRTGLDPRLVLAQSALETGYGKSAPNMNFFGIKSHGRKGGSTLSTQEFEGGRMVQQPASFRGYETPEQSFTDYADFITSNPRYKGVLEADGLEAQIAAMAKSGYATDPDYGSKLASIASRFDPNSPKVIAAETMGLLGKGPQTATTGTQGAAPMMQEEKPRGLLGSLGIQKMEEGAAGETGQRFYQRDTFKDTAAILAQGFGRMGIMGMEEIADDIAKQRTENKARNKTAEYLRKAGRTDLADMVDQGLIGGREAASVLMQKPATGEIREIDNKLVRVMPDGSVAELYASDTPAELTADMREYNLAKEQGFTGSFIEFIQAQKGGGLQIRTSPDGTTEIIQGGPASTKLTEGQSKATGFFARSDEANKLMSELEMEGTELRNVISGAIPFGNYMRTPEGQKYDQAKRNFINAILRQESGAVIGPSEFASAELQYFPQPGDSPEVIAQKKANRETAVNALKVAAGPGAEVIGAPAPTSGGVTDDPLGLRN